MTTAAITSGPRVTSRQQRSAFLTAEWIKLRTLRSTTITLAVAAIVAVGMGAIACQHLAAQVSGLSAVHRADYLRGIDLSDQSLLGNAIAQLAVGALGVLVVTGEFSTGMIRASLAAMPQRQVWMAAKLAVFGAVALLMGQFLTFSSFGVGQAILSTQHVGLSLGDPGALRAVVATGIYITLVGLMGAALGLVIRHTAGALSTLLGVLFVLTGLIGVLPAHWQPEVSRFLPYYIGEQAVNTTQLPNHFSTWAGIGLMAGYVAVLIAIGCVLLERRDA